MRTGPFSDPVFVTLVNRYFVPVHLDNRDGSGRRYGMEPGHENAYILFETPEVAGGPPVETVVLDTLNKVLDPAEARRELLTFLAAHPDLKKRSPEMEALSARRDPESRAALAERLMEEGDSDGALAILDEAGLPARARLLQARTLRLIGRLDEAAGVLARLDGTLPPALVDLERIRLTYDGGHSSEAASLLDTYLTRHAAADTTGEAHYLRGWLHHLAGDDERALEVWRSGLRLHPPTGALFSQKAHLTLIRANWELPDNVDQATGENHEAHDAQPQPPR